MRKIPHFLKKIPIFSSNWGSEIGSKYANFSDFWALLPDPETTSLIFSDVISAVDTVVACFSAAIGQIFFSVKWLCLIILMEENTDKSREFLPDVLMKERTCFEATGGGSIRLREMVTILGRNLQYKDHDIIILKI